MQAFQIILAAILPTIVLLVLIHSCDKFDKVSIPKTIIAFLAGIIAFIIAFFAEKLFHSILFAHYFQCDKNGINALLQLGILSFIIVAAVEELLKFGALRLLVYNPRFIREPMDGIVFAVSISMGFAFAENWLYLTCSQTFIPGFLLRAFAATPAHAVFATIMGYFFGKARFTVKRKRIRLLIFAIISPLLMHGSYNFFLIADWMPLYYAFISVALLIGFIILSRKLIIKALMTSPFSRKDKWQKSITESQSRAFRNKLSELKLRLQQNKAITNFN